MLLGTRRFSFVLLIFYAFSLLLFPSAILYPDDAKWLNYMHQFLSGAWGWDQLFFIRTPTYDRFISHSLLGAFLHQIPYRLYPSVKSIYVWSGSLFLMAHYVLMEISGEETRRKKAQLSSVFFFFIPTVAVYLSLRTWQLIYLPLCLALSFWGIFRYIEQQKLRNLYIAMGGAALATHFHPSAWFFVLAIALIFYSTPSIKNGTLHFLLSSVLYLVITSPMLLFLVRSEFWLLPVGIILAIVATPIGKHFFPKKDRWLPILFVLIPIIFPFLVKFKISPMAGFLKIAEFFSTPFGWVSNDVVQNSSWPRVLLSPTILVWIACGIGGTIQFFVSSTFDKALWYLTWVPTIGLILSGALINELNPARIFVLAPATSLYLISMLARSPKKSTAGAKLRPFREFAQPVLLWGIILLVVFDTLKLEYKIGTGKLNLRFATFGEKSDVITYLSRQTDNPRLIILCFTKDTQLGWNLLLSEGNFRQTTNVENFYILEPKVLRGDANNASFIDQDCLRQILKYRAGDSILAGMPITSYKKFRSLQVFKSSVYRPELGAVISPSGKNIMSRNLSLPLHPI